jgi:hypothetical protein
LQTRVAYSLRSMLNGLDGRAERDGVPSEHSTPSQNLCYSVTL